MKELRNYQVEAIAEIRAQLRSGAKRALCVLPTGSGKAVILAKLIQELHEKNPQIRVLVLVPKVRLVQQLSAELTAFRVPHGDYCATIKKYNIQSITVGTYQSISRLPPRTPFDTIILDEAHRFDPSEASASRELVTNHSHDTTRVVGFTATPYRGARPLWALGDYWPRPCFTLPITDLMRLRYLVRARLVGGDHAFDTSKLHIRAGEWATEELTDLAIDSERCLKQIKDALPRLHDRKHVVWMCIDQSHARMVHELLEKLGEPAEIVISDNAWSEREDALGAFETGGVRHLVSVSIVTEGYDFPPTDGIVLLKPMRSVVSYIQAVGRGLRISPGKVDCIVLDYGGVVAACGPLDRPAIDLDGAAPDRARKARENLMEELGYRVCRCEECGSFFFPPPSAKPACTHCGHVQTIFEKMRKLADEAQNGELYADHEWGKLFVVGMESVLTDAGLDVTFITETQGVKGVVTLTFWAPNWTSQPNVYEMGKLRRTKAWARNVFGATADKSARASVIYIHEQAKVMPKVLKQLDGGDFMAEGSQPRSGLMRLEEVQQEKLI